MRKSVLISIRPKWCELIASGEKNIEVRKNKPKIETPFKCYIYCTAGNGTLHTCRYGIRYHKRRIGRTDETCLNGKIIGEFVCDKIYMLAPLNHVPEQIEVETESCLTRGEIVNYLKGKGYAWHISELKIYNTPKVLEGKAPQSWRYMDR